MKRYVCAVFDSAVDAFAQPFFVPSLGVALRSFTDEVNRNADDNNLARHPDDYTLWVLATFDEDAGMFEGSEQRRVLLRAKDAVRKEA